MPSPTTGSSASTTSRRATELCLRLTLWAAALLCAAAWAPSSARGADCPLLTVGPCIQATLPPAVGLGTPTAGSTTTSAEQAITVSSNDSWGLRISSDLGDGRMAQFDGSGYVASGRVLSDPLRWSLSSIGTTSHPLNFSALSSSAATVVSGRAATSCVLLLGCGNETVRVRFAQTLRFSDRPVAPMTYRIKVTYVAQHGF